jgi:lysine-N-methylase
LLENYLIHYVLKNLFPFGRRGSSYYVPQSIFTEYELMTAHYLLVNGLLTGMAGHYKADFNEGHVVKLIQAFSKTVEHSPVLLSDIATYLQGRDPDRIKRIAALLSDASPLSASTTGRQPQSNAQAPPQRQGHFFRRLITSTISQKCERESFVRAPGYFVVTTRANAIMRR